MGFKKVHYETEVNHQIVFMWKEEVSLSILHSDDQVVTMEALHSGKKFSVSVVYAICSKHGRRRIKDSWLVGGNFNVISNWNEKIGERFINDGSMAEFYSFIVQSELTDISANRQPFPDQIISKIVVMDVEKKVNGLVVNYEKRCSKLLLLSFLIS
uniref:Uncharacterized protein n=1 Tax=Kalanchoe fedtschenkoi TaxID=63787 RepID=A0A7N0T7G0_KALFE